jgi:hypothetical protein
LVFFLSGALVVEATEPWSPEPKKSVASRSRQLRCWGDASSAVAVTRASREAPSSGSSAGMDCFVVGVLVARGLAPVGLTLSPLLGFLHQFSYRYRSYYIVTIDQHTVGLVGIKNLFLDHLLLVMF